MRRAARIDVVPDDLAAVVDVKRVGERGARRIDRRDHALVEQKAMLGPAGIDVHAHDRPGIGDPKRPGDGGAWNIDRREDAVVQQESMTGPASIGVTAHDLAMGVAPGR